MYRLSTLLVLVLVMLSPPLLAQRTVPVKEPPSTRTDDTPKKKEEPKKEKEPPPIIAGKTFDKWFEELADRDPSVRRDAVQVMPFFGKHSAPAAPRLAWLVQHDFDVSVRINAAIVLMHVEVLNKDVDTVVRALISQLDHFQLTLRYHAIVTIGRFGPDARKDALPYLVRASGDRAMWELRQAACSSLFQVGNDPKEGADSRAVAALIAALSDDCAKVRIEAVMGLAMMGRINQDALRQRMLQSLKNRLNEKDRVMVVWAYFGLLVNEPGSQDTYLTEIANLLKRGDVPTKLNALRALTLLNHAPDKEFKKKARERVSSIIDALRDDDQFVIVAACNALADLKISGMEIAKDAADNMKAIIDAEEKKALKKEERKGLKEFVQNCHDVITGKKIIPAPPEKAARP